MPIHHDAIHRHFVARLDQYPFPYPHAAYRRHFFLIAMQYGRHARLQFHQSPGGRNGLMTEHALQITANQDHEYQIGHGVKIHFAHLAAAQCDI